jgi:F0F1-type ATP synthase membrane subunit a
MKNRQAVNYAIAVLVFGAAVLLIHFFIAQKSQRPLARMTEVNAIEMLLDEVESSVELHTYANAKTSSLLEQVKKLVQAYEASSENILVEPSELQTLTD